MIGVDPGGTYTAVLARPALDSTGPLYGATVVRDDRLEFVMYLLEVFDTIAKARHLDRGAHAGEVAVENLNAPTGWKHGERAPIDPDGLIRAGLVLGAILGRWPNAHLIEPGGNGSAPLSLYPATLIGPREKVGTGRLRHLRSAWDVAGTALRHPDPTKADPGMVGRTHLTKGPPP